MLKFRQIIKTSAGKEGTEERKRPPLTPPGLSESQAPISTIEEIKPHPPRLIEEVPQTPAPLQPEEPVAKVEPPSLDEMVSAMNIYGNMVDFLKNVAERLNKGEAITGNEIIDKVKQLVDEVVRAPMQLGALIEAETPENYPFGHMVSVCILAVRMGVELLYDRKKLADLGTGALLLDIGMTKLLDIAKVKRKLGPVEFEEVKKHPEYGAKMLEQIDGLSQAAIDVVMQHHERPDGKGYPFGLRSTGISELSKLVNIADVYVALIQSRPQRGGLSPHEAVKELMQNARLFSPVALRALLHVISIYPVGTWIELNSRDVGKVIKQNREQPLRPVVEIVCDKHGQMFESKSVVSLAERPQLYITGVLEKEKVEKWGLDEPA